MNIGKMRHRIEIQKYSEIENEVGEIIKSWITYKKLWASKTQLKSSSGTTNDKETIDYTYRFTIRYNNDINESMRIVYKDTIYDIKHINSICEFGIYETRLDCIHHKEGVYNE